MSNRRGLLATLAATTAATLLWALPTAAAPYYRVAKGGAGVEVSNDGKSWASALATVNISQVVFAPTDAREAFAGRGLTCDAKDPPSAYVTRDGGKSWTLVNKPLAAFAVHPRDATLVYAGGCDGVSKSTDGGKTFTLLPGTALTGYVPLLLAIAPSAPSTLYALYTSSSGYVLPRRSTDGGSTWTNLDDYDGQLANPIGLQVEPRDPNIVHLQTADETYLSTDGGQSWQAQEY
jgi:photosystem II stability/assembly factor-like uncharacterized protein